jgi:GNAT superfamily N-acetyltransferase
MTLATSSETSIRVATASDEDRAIAVLALAFATDPVARWTWRNQHTYLTHFATFTRAFGGRSFAAGTAHLAGDFDGVALWLPPGVEPDSETMAALVVQTVPEAEQAEMFAVLEQMGHYHPAEPHWYLPMIGIDPTRQGRGFGSALLQHALSICDRDGVPAYLESSNPKNLPLYQRHGFEAIGAVQAGASPTIVPMYRKPR